LGASIIGGKVKIFRVVSFERQKIEQILNNSKQKVINVRFDHNKLNDYVVNVFDKTLYV
jgi:hypothetical protein